MKQYRFGDIDGVIMTTSGCDCYIPTCNIVDHLNSMQRVIEKCYSEIADRNSLMVEMCNKVIIADKGLYPTPSMVATGYLQEANVK